MIRSLIFSTLLLGASAQAEIVVRDDAGQDIRLAAPARRIVSLAPHITENLFAAGAGEAIVGAVDYSDYPPAAKQIRRVGGYSRIDVEAIAALRPDLIIAWESGNNKSQMDAVRRLGIPIFLTQPDRMADIARDLERFGQLAGTAAHADGAARNFRLRLSDLQTRFSQRPTVRIFYQVWKSPLMTIGNTQIISDTIRLCGGENIFGRLTQKAPKVALESVLEANPEVIVASGMGDARPEWLDDWRRWPGLTATQRGNLFHINPDIVQRHTPRILDGAETLCRQLEQARDRRPAR